MEQGAWIVSASAATALASALLLGRRLSGPLVLATLAAAGAGLGFGGMVLQANPSSGEFAAAVLLLAIFVPAHAHVVLGPFGPRR